MNQNKIYVILLLLAMSEKMFVIVGSFLFGYCVGYYSFELVKYRNRKNEIHDFFLSCNKNDGNLPRINNRKIGTSEN